jgi:phosphoribosylamine-glycine ligase
MLTNMKVSDTQPPSLTHVSSNSTAIKGIKINVEGWFNGKVWARPFNYSIENDRLMEGNIGPIAGCMGNVIWPTNGDRLTADTLELLEPLLTKVNYIGPISIKCLITPEDVWFITFTPRFRYDTIQAWSELIQMPLFDYLYTIASGQREEVPYHSEEAISVRMSLHPYPSEEGANAWTSIQVLNVPKEAKKHVWLADVKLVDGVPMMAGVDGVVGCVTARGATVREAQRRAYRTIRNITICDDVQYRKDIGDTVDEEKKMLKGWGWLQ